MPKRRALKIGATTIVAAGTLLGLAAAPGGGAATAARASGANSERPASAVMDAMVMPFILCYYPLSGFYCAVQTQHGSAPLFNASNVLIANLPVNDKVYVTCYYNGNPGSPWTGDGYEDHVKGENIPNSMKGHIPDYYVNLGNQTPGQAGIPPC